MKIETKFPVASISGRIADGDVVLVKRGDKCYARKYSPPRNPQTKDQVAVRRFLAKATRSWGCLTQAQRLGWEDYAQKCFINTITGSVNGYNTFSKVQYYRQAYGLDLLFDPPGFPPPPAPVAVIQKSASAPDEFRFVVEHRVVERKGMLVAFEITPAMPSPGRKPRSIEFRMVRHVGPESFFPLLNPSGTYVIRGARFAVESGQRYGVRLRFITADGVPGAIHAGDFIKEVVWMAPPVDMNGPVQRDLFSIEDETGG